MRAYTLKNIPEATYEGIKALAEHHHRSMNKEIVMILNEKLENKPVDHLALADQYRIKPIHGKFEEDDINKFKNEGRK